MAKQPKILFSGVRAGRYVVCWKEGRNYVVQVWNSGKPDGDPNGDWEMPAALGQEVAVVQALAQTKK